MEKPADRQALFSFITVLRGVLVWRLQIG
uniref:Uncharacterized protein n=1 Tax=Rhizophora mucronata TaxID=61149 RepID=A0A2P2QH83_RHIMU